MAHSPEKCERELSLANKTGLVEYLLLRYNGLVENDIYWAAIGVLREWAVEAQKTFNRMIADPQINISGDKVGTFPHELGNAKIEEYNNLFAAKQISLSENQGKSNEININLDNGQASVEKEGNKKSVIKKKAEISINIAKLLGSGASTVLDKDASVEDRALALTQLLLGQQSRAAKDTTNGTQAKRQRLNGNLRANNDVCKLHSFFFFV